MENVKTIDLLRELIKIKTDIKELKKIENDLKVKLIDRVTIEPYEDNYYNVSIKKVDRKGFNINKAKQLLGDLSKDCDTINSYSKLDILIK